MGHGTPEALLALSKLYREHATLPHFEHARLAGGSSTKTYICHFVLLKLPLTCGVRASPQKQAGAKRKSESESEPRTRPLTMTGFRSSPREHQHLISCGNGQGLGVSDAPCFQVFTSTNTTTLLLAFPLVRLLLVGGPVQELRGPAAKRLWQCHPDART